MQMYQTWLQTCERNAQRIGPERRREARLSLAAVFPHRARLDRRQTIGKPAKQRAAANPGNIATGIVPEKREIMRVRIKTLDAFEDAISSSGGTALLLERVDEEDIAACCRFDVRLSGAGHIEEIYLKDAPILRAITPELCRPKGAGQQLLASATGLPNFKPAYG